MKDGLTTDELPSGALRCFKKYFREPDLKKYVEGLEKYSRWPSKWKKIKFLSKWIFYPEIGYLRPQSDIK